MRDVNFKITAQQAVLVLEAIDAWERAGYTILIARGAVGSQRALVEIGHPREGFIASGVSASDALCQAVPTMRMILEEETKT